MEVKYPSQTVTMRFGEHVKLVQQYMDHESMRGRYYTCYEALQVVLQFLHINFCVDLTNRVAEEFGVAHDCMQVIPFTVQMSHIGTSLIGWAEELGLHSWTTSRVTSIEEA
jgi:hypothetical protein